MKLRTAARYIMLAAISGIAGPAQAQGPGDSAVIVVDPLPAVEVRPRIVGRTALGDTVRFEATIRRMSGAVASADVVWRTSSPAIVEIDPSTGVAVARGSGTAHIWAEVAFGESMVPGSPDRAEPASPRPASPPPGSAAPGDASVTYPSKEVAFLAGPQLKVGSSLNPYPWYDKIAVERGAVHAQKVLGAAKFDNALGGYTYYYDLGLSLYLLYYRTGDVKYRDLARALVDRFYDEHIDTENTKVAPRSVAMTGLLLRALDGRPEIFDYAVRWATRHDRSWLSRHFGSDKPWAGIRDGGFTLLYLAQIGAVHPDPAIRAEFTAMALAAGQWYARIQSEDGAWYYGKPGRRYTQPFQVGFLLEGLIATHQLTNDAGVESAILDATDWLYRDGFDASYPWEAMHYNVPEDRAKRKAHPGPKERENATWGYRQNNATVIHAFGYAYQLTGDEKYRKQGDHLLEATFNYDPADPRRSTGLAFDNGKLYNQNYRTSGRYLVWRLGR